MARGRGRVRSILFRIFYSTTFTLVFLLTIGFVCVGPIDALYQSYRRNRLIDIFVIAGIYVLTALLAIFLYSSRLYTNRSIMKDIPKTYLPLDKVEVANRRVWRLIEDCKSRSAVVAYLARPRAKRVEEMEGWEYVRERIEVLLKPEHKKGETTIFEPRWGLINHPGWAGPANKETPGLDYEGVVKELPDLIEARAVSLAPVDHSLGVDEQGLGMVDEQVIEALTRPEEVGMRGYVSQLIGLGVLGDNSLMVAFLTLYERARFAPEPLSEDEFKTLMRMFAEILRTTQPINTGLLNLPADENAVEDLEDPPAPALTQNPNPPRLTRTTTGMTSTSSLASSIAGSVRHHRIHWSDRDRATSFATTLAVPPPRMSHDSVRSLSSIEAYHEFEPSLAGTNEDDVDNDTSWTAPTSRPPFFRARSSQSASAMSRASQSRSRGARSRNTSSRNTNRRRRSRVRRAISRASIQTDKSSIGSLGSARSNAGSVIRLNSEYDGARESLPFEYVVGNNEDDHRQGGVAGPPRAE